jgi:hypothetical protein
MWFALPDYLSFKTSVSFQEREKKQLYLIEKLNV